MLFKLLQLVYLAT